MHGRQYFYGLTLGAGYRIGEHFSVYGGVRGVLSSAHYDGYLRNIQVNGGDRGGNKMVAAPEYFGKLSARQQGTRRSQRSSRSRCTKERADRCRRSPSRQRSQQQLEKMGFTNFDKFNYIVR